MVFTEVLFFEVCSTLLDTSAKMPPGDHRRPRKQREVAGADTLEGLEGKKTAP